MKPTELLHPEQRRPSKAVQIEPSKKERLRIAVPVENIKGLQSEVSEHFARASYILIADV